MRRVIIIAFLFVMLLLGGTIGYMLFENTGFWSGLYLTIITVFTVGYGDIVPIHPAGKVFTVLLVITSVSFVMYTFSKITETMIEGEIRGLFKRRNMNKQVQRQHDHYIVCGFGRIGREICSMLQQHGLAFVVIENDPDVVKEIEELGYLELEGEASDDDTLLEAGIEKAKGLISVVSTDADNLYVTLTARGLNPSLYIMARSSGTHGAHTKLMRAGASKVISPYSIGAKRMAHLIIRPTVTDFLDMTMRTSELGLNMEELRVSSTSSFVGKDLVESEIHKRFNLIVICIKREDGKMLFNPKPDVRILAGDILIVIGSFEEITELTKLL